MGCRLDAPRDRAGITQADKNPGSWRETADHAERPR
jgi:hypothetical protein